MTTTNSKIGAGLSYQFAFDVSVTITVSKDQFDFITYAIRNHSDTKIHAEVGGFWYGNMNMNLNSTLNAFEFEVSTRQLNKILKAFEMPIPLLALGFFDKKGVDEFRDQLMEIFTAANSKKSELNK